MVLKGPRFCGSPVRTYVVLGSLAGAVSLAVVASLLYLLCNFNRHYGQD